ncbi:hypothetical protein E4U59_001337 [Claviceps monticola]|nr:hypothetical protein E4U59_001337 [Claviceps monticola]
MSDLASYRSTNQPTALSHWTGQNYLGPPLPANPAASGSDIESNTKPEKGGAARELPRQVASSTSPENRAVDKRKDGFHGSIVQEDEALQSATRTHVPLARDASDDQASGI